MSDATVTPPPQIPQDPTLSSAIATYLSALSNYIVRELRRRPIANTAQNSVLLLSPAGKIWEVKVSDAGVLSTTQIIAGGGL